MPTEQQAIWVRWVDSCANEGWNGRADTQALRTTEFLQIGFVIFEDEQQVTLSPTTYTNGHDPASPYHSPIAIPKIAILERGIVEVKP